MTTESVKMADEADIPPLEDMTEVLKKAEVIREQRFGSGNLSKEVKIEDAKQRAKVTKKNPPSGGTSAPKEALDTPDKLSNSDCEKKKVSNAATTKVNSTSTSGQGMFGGMKKGFLFGSSSKQSSKSPSSEGKNERKDDIQRDTETKTNTPTATANSTQKEEMPYITPSGKNESGLTFDEVQQAMSEAKGLLDNQDWITDDLLNKIEKNDTLVKQFSDPQFMSALQEFQTNPQAAMEKYKGNTEVEKFLLDFCGLLGNHFNDLGSSNANSQPSEKSPKKSPPSTTTESKSQKEKSSAAKIVELGSGDRSNNSDIEKRTAKIVELSDDKDTSTSASDRLSTVPKEKSGPHIRLHDPQNGADIQELPPPTDDEAVKEVLNDPNLMETLTDPKVMGLIKTLREDPVKGQRIVDKADPDLKDKIRFLVSRGLLQFQMS